jgi:hypothetical protein
VLKKICEVVEKCKKVILLLRILEEAEEATLQLLPAKFRDHYEKVFSEFNEWAEKQRVMTINEEVLLSYFLNLKKYAISSTWSKYSMLKAAIKVYKNIDIGKYSRKLTAYLRSESRGYKAKKAAVLEGAHVEEFFVY